MAIIIDGYNLLHVTGISGVEARTTLLHQSRHRLLRFLLSVLSPEEAASTTIVFDAKEAPPGLPVRENHGGITALYAKDYDEADDLIEELIRKDNSPRRLLVVSSDHRLQRAARRRKASFIDSDDWLTKLEARAAANPQAEAPSTIEQAMQADAPEHWQQEFSDINVKDLMAELETEVMSSDSTIIPDGAGKPAEANDKPGTNATEESTSTEQGEPEKAQTVENPFPPGYAEDVLHDEAKRDDYNPFPPGYGEDVT